MPGAYLQAGPHLLQGRSSLTQPPLPLLQLGRPLRQARLHAAAGHLAHCHSRLALGQPALHGGCRCLKALQAQVLCQRNTTRSSLVNSVKQQLDKRRIRLSN